MEVAHIDGIYTVEGTEMVGKQLLKEVV